MLLLYFLSYFTASYTYTVYSILRWERLLLVIDIEYIECLRDKLERMYACNKHSRVEIYPPTGELCYVEPYLSCVMLLLLTLAAEMSKLLLLWLGKKGSPPPS